LLYDNERTSLYHGSWLSLTLIGVLTASPDGSISITGLSQEGNIVELETFV
jgi:hypothetical protein